MLGQIRRHIAKKNEKLFYIFVLFIVAFGISIVHYMFLVSGFLDFYLFYF